MPVQINGKLRGRVTVPAGRDRSRHRSRPPAPTPRIAELLAGKTIVKVIVVPGRMVNFVTK